MPRSPLVTSAVKDLAAYFKATTDAAFIDRTWSINSVSSDEATRKNTVSKDPNTQISAYGSIAGRSLEYEVGTNTADHIANLINGAVCVGKFLKTVGYPLPKTPNDYDKMLQIYSIDGSVSTELKSPGDLRENPAHSFDEKAAPNTSQHPQVNLYAITVLNPFMGPMTKDTGAIEVFMNSIPTLELSKCVPYLNVEVISLLRTAGTVAPPLTLTGFLNPSALKAADVSILNAQGTVVRTEASTLGSGLVSGMELFTSPQTLVNMGATGPEFVPVIDRLRPLASLGNLTLSTKIQGGTLTFTTGRLEITIHDRSRLREMAAFVRPDLYGTTFLDITYGWSHPEGGISSRNSYGKFLDALKSTTRFRIAGSTYNFEEGGQLKVTLNIQTVGSTDLLYLGPKEMSDPMKEMNKIIRRLNDVLTARRARNTSPSMADYDFLAVFQDPASAMAASSDKDVIQKVRKLLEKLSDDDEIEKILKDLLGSNLTKDSEAAGNGSVIDKAQDSLQASYDAIISAIPTYDQDEAFGTMSGEAFAKMSDNTFYAVNPDTGATEDFSAAEGESSGVTNRGQKGGKKTVKDDEKDFYSYGSVFMNMIAKPIKESGQYDEVQVVFYPFNRYAGAVHGLPISSFPIEKERLKKAIDELARRSPNVSARQIIGVLYDRFTHFTPARAYLMAGFYDQSKADNGTIERFESKAVFEVKVTNPKNKSQKITKKVAASTQLTFEERLAGVGIPERRFVLPVVQVAVEGCPLTDEKGDVMKDERGNPKTLIKIHVFDSAMDPHATLTDIIRTAKDNELGVITNPVATVNSLTRSAGTIDNVEQAQLNAAAAAIKAGEDAGLLEAVSVDSLEATDAIGKDVIANMSTGNTFYRVVGGYDEIKKLVTAGIPTITYGSSTSALTSVSLSSNTSPGLGNVQLLRAFTEPGEVRAESLTSGVPMLVVPSQLSISTFGCPLFSPMQRLFIDFGTGTSIDNLYNVISIDSTIGKDGFKTDVKLGFADGFAQYRSLNQNLALLAMNMQRKVTGNTTINPAAAAAISGGGGLPFATRPLRDPSLVISDARRFARQILVDVLMPIAQLEANAKAALERELRKLAAKVQAKVEAEKEKAIAKAESIIPEETKVKIAKAQKDVEYAVALAKEKSEPVIRAALLAQQYAQIIALLSELPASVGEIILAEVLLALDEARKQAAANVKVEE